MTTDEMLSKIDQLFNENRAADAKEFMLQAVEEAKANSDQGLELTLYNELMGYYRQVSDRQGFIEVSESAQELADKMELRGTVPFATTLLNIANCYRSFGEKELSLQYYMQVEEIYRGNLPQMDLRMAGFYNNKSLLYEELGWFEEAEQALLEALEIVKANNAGFEIAVTYANLANTCVASRQYNKAEEYATTAIACFEERNCIDAHYAAAVSALGLCYFEQTKYQEASDCFKRGMGIVEESLGRNSQYERLKGNYEACVQMLSKQEESGQKPENGLEICKAFYETFGKPMLQEKFAPYKEKIAVGLVGQGSDCYGFDDAISRDHDWGPGFCLFVSRETYEAIGEALQQAYEELPTEFMGYKRMTTQAGSHRLGVHITEEFYQELLVCPVSEAGISREAMALIPEYALASAVNGEVFADPEGSFTRIREALLLGYPEKLQFLKIAEDVANFTQCGQYNYYRMMERKDTFTAKLMLADACKAAMKLMHHMFRKYTPHDKWLRKSTEQLPDGEQLIALLQKLQTIDTLSMEQAQYLTEQIGVFFSTRLYAMDFISDVDPYLDHHIEELTLKASLLEDTKEELVDKVVRLEFEAFDKVKNEGGRASCQNNWPTFRVMRSSQYLTWNKTMLLQYYYDFKREYELGHNLITEKYGRMMESTAPQQYDEIKENFPELSEEKKQIINTIVAVQMSMAEAFAEEYPAVAGNARSLHTYEDNYVNTSYETYLRGELGTYSDKMLQLYGRYVIGYAENGGNIAYDTISNTARLYGFKSITELENF